MMGRAFWKQGTVSVVPTILLTSSCQASAWSSLSFSKNFFRKHCLMTWHLVWCTTILQGNRFQALLIKLLNFTCTILFQNLSSHYLLGIQLFNLARTCKEYINTRVTSPCHNLTITTSWWYQYIQMRTVLGLQLC